MSKSDSGMFERRSVSAETIIMREGEPGNCAYLIQAGRVVVYTEGNGKTIELARLGVGEIFGEMALASDIPRSATVKVIEDCQLIVITRDVLEKKLARSDTTVQAIIKMLINRMVIANRLLAQQGGTIQGMTKMTLEGVDRIANSLSDDQKKRFEDEVQPKMHDYLEALKAFDN